MGEINNKNVHGDPYMELLRRLSLALLTMMLIGCGGDGSLSNDNNTDPGDGDDNEIVISLAISSTEVSSQNPATVSATVLNDGKPSVGTVVNFSTTIGNLSPDSGTALTNSEGIATITLTAGDTKGAGNVTASVEGAENVSIGFTTQGDETGEGGDVNITLRLENLAGEEVDTITASKPGRVIATVNGITSPVIVAFTSTVGEIPIPTAITDENNEAVVDILAGNTLGAGTVTAGVETGETGELLLVVGSATVKMGSGDPFQENVAAVSLAQISAGGTTVVTVNMIDDEGNPFTETIDVNFSSGCTSLTTPTATLSTPVTTSNGTATSTYLAKGCVGDDPINVTANAGGINLSATAVVNVLPADVGSIEFVSASPENISILGTGSSESSTVIFRVLDTNGNPVNNQEVDFELNTTVGGIVLNPTKATTNLNGEVQTVVNSGTVATTVRVKASITGSDPQIATQSSKLVISTGIPDQDSISISASTLNPEGWNYDGEEVEVTARLADAFNNPVPDGTAVNFTTEGGAIEPSCITSNGFCSVMWRSQFPKPEGEVLTKSANTDTLDCIHSDFSNIPTGCPDLNNTMGQRFGGRATILATAIGEESFPDLNGNGRFDASEVSSFVGGTDLSGRPFDIAEAFVDHNEDTVYNPAESSNPDDSGAQEEFVDFNEDGAFSVNDGLYNGVLCSEPAHAGCDVNKQSVNVNDSLVLVMSGSSPYATYSAASLTVATKGAVGFSAILADLHNQPLPAGSTVTFEVAGDASIIGKSSFTVPSTNHNGGLGYGVTIKGGEEPGSAVLTVSVETPNGVATGLPSVAITVQ